MGDIAHSGASASVPIETEARSVDDRLAEAEAELERLRVGLTKASEWLTDCADVMEKPPHRRDTAAARKWRADMVREWAGRCKALAGYDAESGVNT